MLAFITPSYVAETAWDVNLETRISLCEKLPAMTISFPRGNVATLL